MYVVYALWSENFDKIYVGFTQNIDERILAHNQGKSKYTSRFKPWHVFYTESAIDRDQALKKEKYYKSGWGRKKLKLELEKWQSGRMRQS